MIIPKICIPGSSKLTNRQRMHLQTVDDLLYRIRLFVAFLTFSPTKSR